MEVDKVNNHYKSDRDVEVIEELSKTPEGHYDVIFFWLLLRLAWEVK